MTLPSSAAPRGRRGLMRAALAVGLLGAAPAAAAAQTPAVTLTPTVPGAVSTSWSGFASNPTASQAPAGLALAPGLNGSLQAYEYTYPEKTSSPVLAKWQRTAASALQAATDDVSYDGTQIVGQARSAYGTAFVLDREGILEARIVRPNGQVEVLPTVERASTGFRFFRPVALAADGTLAVMSGGSGVVGVQTHKPGGAWEYRTLSLNGSSDSAGTTPAFVSTPDGGHLLATLPVDREDLVIHTRPAGSAEWERTTTTPLGVTPDGGSIVITAAISTDGWLHLAMVRLIFESGDYVPHVVLVRRTPAGAWDVGTDLGAIPAGDPGIDQLEILPATEGRATVLSGTGNWRSSYSLRSYDVAAPTGGAPAVNAQTLMTGHAAGGFDLYRAPTGKQYVIWVRQSEAYAGPGWPTSPDTVAVQSRATPSGPWSAPELLSANARAINPDQEAYLRPALQASGTTLYAAWYDERGSSVALATAATAIEQPKAPEAPVAQKPVAQAAAGSRTLNLNAVLRFSGKARKCPQAKNVRVAVRKQRANGTLSSQVLAVKAPTLTTKLVAGGCQITGTIELKRRPVAGTRVGVTLRAIGYRVRAVRIVLT